MKKIIATDLDGTLFYPKRRMTMISSKNLKFVQNYIDQGGKVIIVSGRNHYFTAKVVERINRPVDVIGCNSAFIHSDCKIVREEFLPTNRIKEIMDEINRDFDPVGYFLMSKNHTLVTYDRHRKFFNNIGHRFYYFTQGVYREPFINSEYIFNEEINHGEVHKIMMFFGISKKAVKRAKEVNKQLREKYSEIETSWVRSFIEITPKGCNKAEGLKFYLNHLNKSNDDLVVVGDSGNDISMFQAFEHSFCMKHAPQSVQKYAKNIIRHFHDLEKFLIKE